MEIKIQLDLPAIISEAVSTERLQPLIDKAIVQAVSSAISDATGYNSEFRKELSQQMKDALPHGLSVSDIVRFQHVLNSAVSSLVQGANSETIKTALEIAARTVLPEVSPLVPISGLVHAARESFHLEEDEAFRAHLVMDCGGGGILRLDGDADSRRPAAYVLQFDKDGRVYACRIDNNDVTPSRFPTACGSFDAMLLSLYVGRANLVVDIDADAVEELAAATYND